MGLLLLAESSTGFVVTCGVFIVMVGIEFMRGQRKVED